MTSPEHAPDPIHNYSVKNDKNDNTNWQNSVIEFSDKENDVDINAESKFNSESFQLINYG